MKEAIKSKKSCVIDNTNPQISKRAQYIEIAQEHEIPIRCIYFKFPKELVFHLDAQRKLNAFRQHLSKHVGQIPIHSWFKNLEVPTVGEGFSEVNEVQFIAGPFESPEDELMFYNYVC